MQEHPSCFPLKMNTEVYDDDDDDDDVRRRGTTLQKRRPWSCGSGAAATNHLVQLCVPGSVRRRRRHFDSNE